MEREVAMTFTPGHNKPISVLTLFETILRLSGRTDLQPEVLGKGSLHGEIDRQWLDGEKAKRLLGWEPKVGLEEGLRRTIACYREHL
jgi:nucleoside-diphosphate-sugar epimerase